MCNGRRQKWRGVDARIYSVSLIMVSVADSGGSFRSAGRKASVESRMSAPPNWTSVSMNSRVSSAPTPSSMRRRMRETPQPQRSTLLSSTASRMAARLSGTRLWAPSTRALSSGLSARYDDAGRAPPRRPAVFGQAVCVGAERAGRRLRRWAAGAAGAAGSAALTSSISTLLAGTYRR